MPRPTCSLREHHLDHGYRAVTLENQFLFHGEASVLPWDYRVVRRSSASVSVELTVQLYRSPFRARRTVTVERSLAAVLLHETIENQAEEDMHHMWAPIPPSARPSWRGGAGCNCRRVPSPLTM